MYCPNFLKHRDIKASFHDRIETILTYVTVSFFILHRRLSFPFIFSLFSCWTSIVTDSLNVFTNVNISHQSSLFQILRGLLPNSDQKRDKASFLLEVIEYIQFLQEKLQKYESMYPGWSDETAKLMPWNNHHGSGDGMIDPQVLKNGASSGLLMSDSSIPVAPSILSSAQNPTESDLIAGVSFKELENPNGFSNKVAASPASLQPNLYPSIGRGTGAVSHPQQRLIPEAVITGSQSEWLRSSFPTSCNVSNDEINAQELTIDEGTISVSSEYSQGLLNTLSQALQNSGIDLSQASISVHINLGRRASVSRRNASSMATTKEQDEPLCSNLVMNSTRSGNRSDESEQVTKKQKLDHN